MRRSQIYAMRGGGFVKIGVSASPITRLAIIATSVPFDIVLVGYSEGTPARERELHQQFAPWRARGEWYRDEGSVKAFADALPQMNTKAPEPKVYGRYERRVKPRRHNTEADAAIKAIGGRAIVARMFGISPKAISHWARDNRFPAYTKARLEPVFASCGVAIDGSFWRERNNWGAAE